MDDVLIKGVFTPEQFRTFHANPGAFRVIIWLVPAEEIALII